MITNTAFLGVFGPNLHRALHYGALEHQQKPLIPGLSRARYTGSFHRKHPFTVGRHSPQKDR